MAIQGFSCKISKNWTYEAVTGSVAKNLALLQNQ
jgi:hypothetical protein